MPCGILPMPAHRSEFPPAIPRRVASQQSPLPLRRIRTWNQEPIPLVKVMLQASTRLAEKVHHHRAPPGGPGPQRKWRFSFDHFVGAGEKHRLHGESERVLKIRRSAASALAPAGWSARPLKTMCADYMATPQRPPSPLAATKYGNTISSECTRGPRTLFPM